MELLQAVCLPANGCADGCADRFIHQGTAMLLAFVAIVAAEIAGHGGHDGQDHVSIIMDGVGKLLPEGFFLVEVIRHEKALLQKLFTAGIQPP